MVPSRLSSILHPLPKFAGLLRSAHALIGLLAVLCLLFFWSARDRFPVVADRSFWLFVLLVIPVVGRYLLKGPEADRGLPAITVSHTMVSIANIDVGAMQTDEFKALMAGLISRSRRPLPAPSGILRGPASDPNAIQEVPPEEAERLRSKDNA